MVDLIVVFYTTVYNYHVFLMSALSLLSTPMFFLIANYKELKDKLIEKNKQNYSQK